MLYIANLTKQNHTLVYRMPEEKSTRHVQIPMGSQVMVHGRDLTSEQAAAIVDQHLAYGLRDVKALGQARGFTGLCYSDKPINVEKIVAGHLVNEDVLVKEGQRYRQESAVALNNRLVRDLPDGATLTGLDLEVVEEVSRTADQPRMREGITVAQQGHEPRPAKGKGRRRA